MNRKTVALFISGLIVGVLATLACLVPHQKRRLGAIKSLKQRVSLLGSHASWQPRGLFILDGKRFGYSDLQEGEQNEIRSIQEQAYASTLKTLHKAALERSAEGGTIAQLTDTGRLAFLLQKPFLQKLDLREFPAVKSARAEAQLVFVGNPLGPSDRVFAEAVDKVRHHFAAKLDYVEIIVPTSTNRAAWMFSAGAHCAFEQGTQAYFSFRDEVMAVPVESIAAIRDDANLLTRHIKGLARAANLGVDAFERCLARPETVAAVARAKEMILDRIAKVPPVVLFNGEMYHYTPNYLFDDLKEELNGS